MPKSSPEINEKIKAIVSSYMQLMADCSKDDSIRKNFEEEPIPFLRKTGMIIPEGVHIYLNKDHGRWAKIYITSGNEEIKIIEDSLSVDVIEKIKNSDNSITETEHKVTVSKPSEIDTIINEKLKDSTVVIEMPYFTFETDVLTEVKFSDNHEITLTAC